MLTAAVDPVFYLHHTWLDKKWWDWQKENPERIYDIGGGKDGYIPGIAGPPPPGVFPPGFENLNLTLLFPDGAPLPGIPFMQPPPGVLPPGVVMPAVNTSAPPSWRPGNVTVEDPVALEDVIDMLGVIPSPLVADVMDIQGGYLCYEYEEHSDVV